MEQNWFNLDLETLVALYEKESSALNTKLLNGAQWHELKDQRKKVTSLAIVLHRKKQAAGLIGPADVFSNGNGEHNN
ncbi:MAG TPA: hypothetical protein VFR58_00565 [Flavisolibacter sp.]|nr:hypothetical protein [Flavisolibacter sp.]